MSRAPPGFFSLSRNPAHDATVFRHHLPFQPRCRFVLYEKGMDFRSSTWTWYNKPEVHAR